MILAEIHYFLSALKSWHIHSFLSGVILFPDMVFNINLGFTGLVNKDATDSRGTNPLIILTYLKSDSTLNFQITIGR